MSAAVANVTIPDERYTGCAGNKFFAFGSITISANPATYTLGGIVMNLLLPLVKASRTPLLVKVLGQTGYIYVYIPGTDASNGLLRIYEQSGVDDSPLDELDDGSAIPAAISGDIINFVAVWHGME